MKKMVLTVKRGVIALEGGSSRGLFYIGWEEEEEEEIYIVH